MLITTLSCFLKKKSLNLLQEKYFLLLEEEIAQSYTREIRKTFIIAAPEWLYCRTWLPQNFAMFSIYIRKSLDSTIHNFGEYDSLHPQTDQMFLSFVITPTTILLTGLPCWSNDVGFSMTTTWLPEWGVDCIPTLVMNWQIAHLTDGAPEGYTSCVLQRPQRTVETGLTVIVTV